MTTSLGFDRPRHVAATRAPRVRRAIHAPPAVLGAVLLLPLLAGYARAHEYWLAPSSYVAKPKLPIEFGAAAGTGFRGEPRTFSATRCVRFIAHADHLLDLVFTARDGDPVWARFAPPDDGGMMVGYESNFASIEMQAAEFDAYLEEEGLTGPREDRRLAGAAVPGRERYRRCAKTWVAGDHGRRALKPLGLPLEIVPLSVPGAGPTLKVRVEHQGRPLRDVLVKAWRTPLAATAEPAPVAGRDSVPVAWQERTDRKGEVTVRLDGAGEWLLSVVHMTASRDSAAADWESSWASLTFARLGAGRDVAPASEMRADNPRR